MTVAAAQQALASLKQKLSETEERALMLEGERSAISYAALAERDAKAVKRLQEINAELVAVEADACSVEAAIAEGERRCAAATQAEQAVAERAKAEQALKLRDQMVTAGKVADKALKDGFAALSEIYTCSAALNRIGCPPNVQLVEANLRRALTAASVGSRFPLGALSPADRRSVVELVGAWAEGIASFAAEREPKAEEKAEEPSIKERAA